MIARGMTVQIRRSGAAVAVERPEIGSPERLLVPLPDMAQTRPGLSGKGA